MKYALPNFEKCRLTFSGSNIASVGFHFNLCFEINSLELACLMTLFSLSVNTYCLVYISSYLVCMSSSLVYLNIILCCLYVLLSLCLCTQILSCLYIILSCLHIILSCLFIILSCLFVCVHTSCLVYISY